jgi:hypothetical protein
MWQKTFKKNIVNNQFFQFFQLCLRKIRNKKKKKKNEQRTKSKTKFSLTHFFLFADIIHYFASCQLIKKKVTSAMIRIVSAEKRTMS